MAEYLDDLLSRVVLWDVKNETATLLTMCMTDEAEEKANYLKEHGYNTEIRELGWLSQIKITRQ